MYHMYVKCFTLHKISEPLFWEMAWDPVYTCEKTIMNIVQL